MYETPGGHLLATVDQMKSTLSDGANINLRMAQLVFSGP